MEATQFAADMADEVANWFGLYGKCGDCICNDDGEEADTTERVLPHLCRRCFMDRLHSSLMEKLVPQIDTAFCPTCGQEKPE